MSSCNEEELFSILKFLENKSILIIGATGFLAKVLVEKILRVQPNLKKLYILIRAVDSNSALQRFNTEVIAKELFMGMRKKYELHLNSFLEEKVHVIPGDIALENLGVDDVILLEEIMNQVELVVNSAATTDFDERYDVAFGINTIGPLRVLEFAKKCSKLRMLLHVSTAYVCGEKEGQILETPLNFGEALNGTSGLDITGEQQLIEKKLKELRAKDGMSEKMISSVMKDFGLERAKKYGWPNTYVFTKSMGEMLLGQSRNSNMPLVIIRPAIITSTWKEPFPGWVEGVRSVDGFVLGYGKGKMNCFFGGRQTILDLIPVDMVVNSMIVAMVAHADTPIHTVYHLGSSKANPVMYRTIRDYIIRYFKERPWVNNDGKTIIVGNVRKIGTAAIIHKLMQIYYLLPLQMLNVLNKASCQYFQNTYTDRSRKVKFLMRLVELFIPYVFFKGVFDDANTEGLRREARDKYVENEMFYFDPKIIKWDDYFMDTHIAGVVKYNFKR